MSGARKPFQDLIQIELDRFPTIFGKIFVPTIRGVVTCESAAGNFFPVPIISFFFLFFLI